MKLLFIIAQQAIHSNVSGEGNVFPHSAHGARREKHFDCSAGRRQARGGTLESDRPFAPICSLLEIVRDVVIR
jgi:hypothetical protein